MSGYESNPDFLDNAQARPLADHEQRLVDSLVRAKIHTEALVSELTRWPETDSAQVDREIIDAFERAHRLGISPDVRSVSKYHLVSTVAGTTLRVIDAKPNTMPLLTVYAQPKYFWVDQTGCLCTGSARRATIIQFEGDVGEANYRSVVWQSKLVDPDAAIAIPYTPTQATLLVPQNSIFRLPSPSTLAGNVADRVLSGRDIKYVTSIGDPRMVTLLHKVFSFEGALVKRSIYEHPALCVPRFVGLMEELGLERGMDGQTNELEAILHIAYYTQKLVRLLCNQAEQSPEEPVTLPKFRNIVLGALSRMFATSSAGTVLRTQYGFLSSERDEFYYRQGQRTYSLKADEA